MKANSRVAVFFDGKCKICKIFKSVIQKLDSQRFIEFIDLWQSKQDRIDIKDLVKELHVVTYKGEIYKGYYAIKYILGNLSVFLPLRMFINSLLMDKIGVVVYKFVARNRMKLNICSNECNH